VVCGGNISDEDDSDRPLSDENIRKVSIGMKDSVRFVLNLS
jgi:hypothetical protein